VGLLGAILVNALMLQDKRHPAPLFNDLTAAPALRPAPPQAAAPPAPARQTASLPAEPRKPDSIGQLLQGGAPAQTPVAAKDSAGDKTAAINRRDSIGQLLKSGAPAAEPAPQAEAPVDRAILNAQKALSRLGYGVRADGRAGAGTKQAIEKFERTRRLPVTGELNPRTRRELAALSGMPID